MRFSLIPGIKSDYIIFWLREKIKASIEKIKKIKIDTWITKYFLFFSLIKLKWGINVEARPPPRNKLTIRSGKVKSTTATSVCSLAPPTEESNHSLVNPVNRPIRIKVATAIVDFLKDNFIFWTFYIIVRITYRF